jgi:hypothetical protein
VNIESTRELVLGYVQDNLEFATLDDKIVCTLPIEYPDGDSVVVFLSERDEGIEISDYGAAWQRAVHRPGTRLGRVKDAAENISRATGVYFWKGRVTALAVPNSVAEVIWHVGLASLSISEAPSFSTSEARVETTFTEEVEQALVRRRVRVLREETVAGLSGHSYTPTIFLPESEIVVEPLSPEPGWQRAASVYVEFGDVGRANGYQLTAVLDDREGTPSEQVWNLLLQVGTVLRWSQRDPWLTKLGQAPE